VHGEAGGEEAERRKRERRLPGATLPHDAQRVALRELETDAREDPDRRLTATPRRRHDGEVLDREQRPRAHRRPPDRRGSRLRSIPSPSNMQAPTATTIASPGAMLYQGNVAR
jgi:hypothetical protein